MINKVKGLEIAELERAGQAQQRIGQAKTFKWA
jgi:hypothetical protein